MAELSPRCRCMIEDMTVRNLSPATQRSYVHAVALSSEHFSVDGTLIEAWASPKSFVPKDGGDKQPPSGDGSTAVADAIASATFMARNGNDTHASTTDPDARLFRKGKGKEAKLCHMGHILIENRNG